MTASFNFLFNVIQHGTRSLRSLDKIIFWVRVRGGGGGGGAGGGGGGGGE